MKSQANQYKRKYVPPTISSEEILLSNGFTMSNGTAKIPLSVMSDKNLSMSARGVYAVLACLTSCTGNTVPTLNAVANVCGITINTFVKYRTELETKGYLTIKLNMPFNNSSRICVVTNPNPIPNERYGIVTLTVLADQSISIKDKALYAYLQCYENDIPSVAEIAKTFNCRKNFIYRTLPILSQFSSRVPTRWKTVFTENQKGFTHEREKE